VTTDVFKPEIVERAVHLQAHCEQMRAAYELAKAVREHAELEFRQALHEMATLYPSLLSDDAVGPWLELNLKRELGWSPEDIHELREVTANLGVV
jgi:hypothetical protein